VLVFALLVAAGIFLFYWLQQRGLFTLISRLAPRARMPERALRLADGAAALDAAIRASYRARRALSAAVLWRLVFRLAVTGEVYLALRFMGQPAGFAECFILQNLGQAVRSAAFLVPAGVGVQEGGYLLLAMALGLRPDVGLALSLAKRFRELVVGLPGLLAWQLSEVRRFKPGVSGNGSSQSS
jgi:putative membrane protein